jgi:prephenate dehydrogenase
MREASEALVGVLNGVNVRSFVPAAVGVVGLGAVGASIGLALRRDGMLVVGHDSLPRHARAAIDLGAVSKLSVGLSGFADCGAIFVAVPPHDIVEVARRLLDATRATVVDVGSVKGGIAEALRHPRFVPSHPIRGTHLSGPSAGTEDLFSGATWAVCPTAATSNTSLNVAEALIRRMGARPLRLAPGEHDRLVARTSHLPHVAATALVHVVGGRNGTSASRLIGEGFLDTTRVARAAPSLWADITLHNRSEVSESIAELIDRLHEVQAAIDAGDHRAVLAFFAHAGRLMEHLPSARRTPASATRAVGRISPVLSVGRPRAAFWSG